MVYTHHEVEGMLPNKSSKDLEIKTLRSFSPISKRFGYIVMVEMPVMKPNRTFEITKEETLEWNFKKKHS